MTEMISNEEKAGAVPAPLVELTPAGPPLTISEAGPNPLPTPEPFDRAESLANLQRAFAALDDEELQVAQLRMLGVPISEISEELLIWDDEVAILWKRARRKLGEALFKRPTAP